MAFDSVSGEIVLFGGSDDDGPLNDTWTWDGDSWTKESPATSPPARYAASMAFDPVSGEIVLFGGGNGSDESADTWTWDGSNWTQEFPANSPPPRFFASMAFDPASGEILLFGGPGYSDTWSWDGSNWAQESPTNSPPARSGSSMAFDPDSGEMVLFGGTDGNFGFRNDTWTWDGSDWTQKSPTTSPPVRSGAAMTFDSASGEMMLFGGGGDNYYFYGDTWTWDGNNWTQESPADSPSARQSASMAFDPSLGEVVLFGGYGNQGRRGDSWTYSFPPATPDLVTRSASDAEASSPVTVEATLADGYLPTGTITFRLYGPDDVTCSATPVFESAPVTVDGNNGYDSPGFKPTGPGSYRWTATYSGDLHNETAVSTCDGPGSVSTVTKPVPPPPPDNCASTVPALRLTSFGQSPSSRGSSKAMGFRIGFISKSAVVRIRPTVTYRVSGKRRTARLKTLTIQVNGRRNLTFRIPPKMKRDFRKAGRTPRKAPVSFQVDTEARLQGSATECFRSIGIHRLRTKVVAIAGRVALRRFGL